MGFKSECSTLSQVMKSSNQKMQVALRILTSIGWPKTWAQGPSSANKVHLAPRFHRQKYKAQRTTRCSPMISRYKWMRQEARSERQVKTEVARMHHWSCRWRRDPIPPWIAWAQTIKELSGGCPSAWAHRHYWGRPLGCSLGWRWEISTSSSIR